VFVGSYADDGVCSLVGKAHKIVTWLLQLQHKCRRVKYVIHCVEEELLYSPFLNSHHSRCVAKINEHIQKSDNNSLVQEQQEID
jgi:hypothetical protein